MKNNYFYLGIGVALCLTFLQSCDSTTSDTNKQDSISKFEKLLGKPKKSSIKGIEHIAKYHTLIRKATTAKEPSYSDGYLMKEFQKAKQHVQQRGQKSNQVEAIFTERGPTNVPGRSRAILPSPNDNQILYTGTAGGGIWRSQDGGGTWSSITDGKVPNMSTSTLAISASAPQTIYAGTGEPFGNLDAIGGIGLLKTTDDGNSWTYLENTSNFGDVGRIEVNPNDADHVVVGADNGIFVSQDGGTTWELTYSGSRIQDLDADPADFNILYGSDNNVGIVKSIDGGQTWNLVFDRANFNNSHSRFEVDIYPSNTDKLIVGVYTPGGNATEGENTDFYVSEDAGETFTLLRYTETANDADANLISGQGWYDNIILAHPFNENIFYVGGVAVFKVTIEEDTFTFESIASGYDNGLNDYVHVDQHGMFSILGEEANEFKILLANDGGIYQTSFNEDPGATLNDWSLAVTTLNSTQFYDADKRNGFDDYVAGAQDNGSWQSISGNTTATSSYSSVGGGDGFETKWHYRDDSKFMITSQFNFFVRYDANGASNASFNDAGADAPFLTKLVGVNNDPETLFAVTSNGVWKTENFGENWNLTTIGNGYYSNGAASLLQVEVSEANPDIVWTGNGMTESSSLTPFVSTDNGASFQRTAVFDDPRSSGHNYLFSNIVASYTNENTAYTLFSGQGAAKILKTDDLGETWTDITGFSQEEDRGFPDVAVYSLIEMPFDNQTIWAGTDLGVFETTDGGATWNLIDAFPSVAVWNMRIVNDQIVMATHGRGVWSATIDELADYRPAAYFDSETAFITAAYKEGFNSNNAIIEYEVAGGNTVDKVEIFLDGESISYIDEEFVAGQTYQLTIPDLSEGVYTVSIIGESEDGTRAPANERQLLFINFEEPEVFVQLNEFTSQDVYTYDGEFVVNNLGGTISSDALNNSGHPYVNNSVYRTILRQPIIVSQNYPELIYQDAAIVEPGDAGGIYDYVLIEATTNLKDWVQLDLYDCDRFNEWRTEYEKGTTAEIRDELFMEQRIDLLNFFDEGDTIALRFTLVTDPAVTSYGWAIKSINESVTLSNDEITALNNELVLYPTVATSSIAIKSSSNTFKGAYEIYDLTGKVITSSDAQISPQGQTIDIENLATGHYFLKLKQDETILKTFRFIKK